MEDGDAPVRGSILRWRKGPNAGGRLGVVLITEEEWLATTMMPIIEEIAEELLFFISMFSQLGPTVVEDDGSAEKGEAHNRNKVQEIAAV